MRTKLQHKNYTEYRGNYQLVLPFDFEAKIPVNDSVRLLSQILEELDYTKLYINDTLRMYKSDHLRM